MPLFLYIKGFFLYSGKKKIQYWSNMYIWEYATVWINQNPAVLQMFSDSET